GPTRRAHAQCDWRRGRSWKRLAKPSSSVGIRSPVPLIEVRGVTKRFGGLIAVRGVKLSVNDGEIVGLMGPNGAGKTALLNVVSGVYQPDAGGISFRDQDITRLSLQATASLGLVRTFQLSSLFMDMTVFENTLIGTYRPAGYHLLSALLGTRTDRR